jgi:hypothetical protein
MSTRPLLEDDELAVVDDPDDESDKDAEACERCAHPRHMHFDDEACGGCSCKAFKPM